MTDDRENEETTPDPWAALESGGEPDLAGGFSFAFDESPALEDPETRSPDAPIEAGDEGDPIEAFTPAPAGDDPQLDDDLAGSWLADDEDDGPATPLTVFRPDEPGSSAIDIGTGNSGIASASSLDVWSESEPEADDQRGPEAIAEPLADTAIDAIRDGDPEDAVAEPADPAFPDVGTELVTEFVEEEETAAPEVAFGAGLTGAAVGVGAATPPTPKKKKSGMGQMIGTVLGGALAIPLTLAILIWGFQKDPFKITKSVPSQLAFLLPQKFQPAARKAAGIAVPMPAPPQPETSAAPVDASVAAVDAVPEPVGSEPEPSAEPSGATEAATAVAAVEPPALTPEPDPALEPPAAEHGEPEPFGAEVALATSTRVEPIEEASVTPPAPEPLDLSGLERAVDEARAAHDAVAAADERDAPARTPLLVDWYKSLAHVAEELVMLEHAAADSGRPLAEPPAPLAALHDALAAKPESAAELARLGRNWLGYSRRTSDGIVLTVTFESARRVGPYWSSKATLPLPKGGVRELAIISRTQPDAAAGDRVLVIGMLFDGDVIWAADCRRASVAAAGAE